MKIIPLILLFSCVISSYSQDTLLVREVYDFNIGDKFHYVEDASNYLPGGFYKKVDRITILEKFYSENIDTVYYKRVIEGYTENLVQTPPSSPYPFELKYYFHSYEDLIYYSNLDSSILSILIKEHFGFLGDYEWGHEFKSDTLVYHSENFCNRKINGYQFSDFSYNDIVEYGEGIGVTKISKEREECVCHVKNLELIYYVKGVDSCGIPDFRTNTSVYSVSGPDIKIYPNPVIDNVNIEVPDELCVGVIKIFDITGVLRLSVELTGVNSIIDLSSLICGVYYLKLSVSESNKIYRLIKM